jgi:septal ring factor EnvC (AmiA/AmiB activator)
MKIRDKSTQNNVVIEKLDKIYDRLSSIEKTLAHFEENIKDQLRRTESLEGEIVYLKKHASTIEGGVRFLTLSGLVTGIMVGVAKLLKHNV